MEAVAKPAAWSSSEVLAARLARDARLAVFNACNSGLGRRPTADAASAVIGVQGLVGNVASLNFAEKLSSLAVRLSSTKRSHTRLYVIQPGPFIRVTGAVLLPPNDSPCHSATEQTAMREHRTVRASAGRRWER
jgi:hypothetical protein